MDLQLGDSSKALSIRLLSEHVARRPLGRVGFQ